MITTVTTLTRDAVQAAVDAVLAAGGGKVVLPPGIYTGAGNVNLPMIAPNQAPVSLAIEGEIPPPAPYLQYSNEPVPTCGTIFQGFGIAGPPSSGVAFSNLFVGIKNLLIRHSNDPQASGIDLEWIGCVDLQDVVVDNGVNNYQSLQPTNPASFGIRLPRNNNNARNSMRGVYVAGYYTGIFSGEHCDSDAVYVQSCYRGIVFQFGHHAQIIQRLIIMQCPYGLVFEQGLCFLKVGQVDFERNTNSGPLWMNSVSDIYDPSNLARGEMSVHVVTAGIGVDYDSLRITGAIGLQVEKLLDGSIYGASPPPAGVTVTIAPSSATLLAGDTKQFAATASNSTQGVDWSATGGSITNTGLFTAGAVGSATVTATSIEDSSKSATATVSVVATPPPPAITTFIHGDSVILSGPNLVFDSQAPQTGHQWYQHPPALGNAFRTASFLIDAGTYKLSVFCVRNQTCGKGLFTIRKVSDNSIAATFAVLDFYYGGGGSLYNTTLETEEKSIPAGEYYIRGEVIGKNASANNYYLGLTSIKVV